MNRSLPVNREYGIAIAIQKFKEDRVYVIGIDLEKNKELWRISLPDPFIKKPVFCNDLLILNSSSRTQKGREATLYAINIHTGFEVFTREFPRENSEQYVIPFVLPIRNYVKEKGDKPLLVYIKKETRFHQIQMLIRNYNRI